MGKTPIIRKDSKGVLALSNLMGITEGLDNSVDHLFSDGWIDPLDSTYTEALNSLENVTTIAYAGEPFTTLAYRYYGTTDAWHILLAYNGYLHPDHVPTGALLNLPNIDKLKTALTQIRSRAGEIIRV